MSAGALIKIAGHPRNVRTVKLEEGQAVAFEMTAGTNKTPPRGMPGVEDTLYHVMCPQETWNKGHLGRDDRSELVVEGYQQPLFEQGQIYIAVVATHLETRAKQDADKERRLQAAADSAERIYQFIAALDPDAPIVCELKAARDKAQDELYNCRQRANRQWPGAGREPGERVMRNAPAGVV